MVLAFEFWGPPRQFLWNASTNLLVFVAKCLGVSWDRLGLAWVSVDPFGTPLGPLGIHGSDPCIWSMNLIHGSDPWIRSYDWLFDVILKLSEALVCFRASGANFLRSITRAIVNKNDGKRIIDFLMSFWDFQKLSFVFVPPGLICLRSITRAIVNKNDGKRIIDFLTSFWDFQKLSFVFAPPGLIFCALSPGL